MSGGRRARPARTGAASAATRSAISGLLSPDLRSEKATSSATVGMTIWLSGSVNTNPTRRRTSRPFAVVSRPSTVTVPLVGADQSVDHPSEGGLAGTVGADDADPLLGQRQVDAVEHHPVAEPVMTAVKRISAIRSALRVRSSSIGKALAAADRAGRQAQRRTVGARRPSIREASRISRIVPEAPHGCPSPIAPPCAHTRSSSMPRSSIDREHDGREGLGDLDRADVGERNAAAGHRRPGEQAPHRGRRAPARAGRADRRRRPRRRSAGMAARPSRAARSVVTATAAAPSEMPQELPAVAVPSGPKDGRSRPSRAGVQAGPRPLVPANSPAPQRFPASYVPACWAANGERMRTGGVLVLPLPGRCRVAGPGSRRPRPCPGRETRAGRTVRGSIASDRPRPSGGQNRHGAVLADSAPPARTSSASPAPTPGRGLQHRVQAGAALPIDRHPGDRVAQSGGQRGDPGDVSAGSEAVADDHVVDRSVRAARPARRRRKHRCGQPDDVAAGQGVTRGADSGPPRADQHRRHGVPAGARLGWSGHDIYGSGRSGRAVPVGSPATSARRPTRPGGGRPCRSASWATVRRPATCAAGRGHPVPAWPPPAGRSTRSQVVVRRPQSQPDPIAGAAPPPPQRPPPWAEPQAPPPRPPRSPSRHRW